MRNTFRYQEGQFTYMVYSLINSGHYKDAIDILLSQVHAKHSRATLSLLAYCYFQSGDFVNSGQCYEQLSKLFPDHFDYRVYHGYSLYLSGELESSLRILSLIKEECSLVSKLKAMVIYGLGDMVSARKELDVVEPDDEVIIGIAVLDYAEGNFEAALRQLESIEKKDQTVSYAIAVNLYQLQDRVNATNLVDELLASSTSDWVESDASLQNIMVEAITLRAAIALDLGNEVGAREALNVIVPADPISLHNVAVVNADPSMLVSLGIEAPPPTLSNLLILCLRMDLPEMAADLLARQPKGPQEEKVRRLRPLVEALVSSRQSVAEAQRCLEEAAKRPAEALQKAAQMADLARSDNDQEAAASALAEYERVLTEFMPLALCRAKVFWDAGDWKEAELSLHGASEFCGESDTYRVLVGNALFMQDKFAEAAAFYEAATEKTDSFLAVNPLVLAHFCVALVMSSQNERAEKTMRRVQLEEEAARDNNPPAKVYHLSIINLVIGTLYISRGNFEFGLNRLVSSMEPFERKLSTETWFHSKRCLLWLAESLSKEAFSPSDSFKKDCLEFLVKCEHHGKDVKACLDPFLKDTIVCDGKNTVTYESRQIKAIILKLFDNN